MFVVDEEAGQPPDAAIELVTVYVPGALAVRSMVPVVGLIINPAVEENVPALDPAAIVGDGSVPFWQNGDPE